MTQTIVAYQNPVTGLYPAHIRDQPDGTVAATGQDAWIRDSVYTGLAVWALSLAYRKRSESEDHARAYELECSVVKLMRGVLFGIVRQAHKLEAFKHSQSAADALHAKYNIETGGTIVGDREWGHLQIDAISLYVLMLAQMTASGLQIIYSLDEVSVVQNLVFYIQSAYRTPDYGIWERGDKSNHGLLELNASSIGMAKAALEAVNGLDLFGSNGGSPVSIIHVLPDEIRRNSTVVESMLPRESNSKEIDASLLCIIGYPAFAVEDSRLVQLTHQRVIRKLRGRYGCKRFLRDGYRTVLEDRTRLHYEPAELQVFEDIECEWPLFFVYLMLDGIFRGDHKQAAYYREQIEKHLADAPPCDAAYASSAAAVAAAAAASLPDAHGAAARQRIVQSAYPLPAVPEEATGAAASLSESPAMHMAASDTSLRQSPATPRSGDGAVEPRRWQLPYKSLPELYYVPLAAVHREREKPHSQERQRGEVRQLMWGQSLFILACLLDDGLVAVGEVDPLNRRHATSPRPEAIVQVVLMAEDPSVKELITMHHGIEPQTPQEVRRSCGIRLGRAADITNAYDSLGRCDKLGLSGRPTIIAGSLATAKLYSIRGQVYAFTPRFADRQDFYVSFDTEFFVDNIHTHLSYMRTHWREVGRPTLVLFMSKLLLERAHASASAKRSLAGLLASLKDGSCGGVRVRLGRFAELLPTSCIERLTFLDDNASFTFLARRRARAVAPVLPFDATATLNEAGCRGGLPLVLGAMHGPGAGVEQQPAVATAARAPAAPDAAPLVSVCGLPVAASVGATGQANAAADDDDDDDALVRRLMQTSTIVAQLDILHSLWQRHGLDYELSLGSTAAPVRRSVRALIYEIYEKAGHLQLWSAVRHAAGMLHKRVDNLASSLTHLLLRQKQVSIGLPPNEIDLTTPLPPDKIERLLYQVCGDNISMAMLYEEILVDMQMFIRTEPMLFSEMLRLRVGLIIQVLCDELTRAIRCPRTYALQYLLCMSPYELKSLLYHIISGIEFVLQPNNERSQLVVISAGGKRDTLLGDAQTAMRARSSTLYSAAPSRRSTVGESGAPVEDAGSPDVADAHDSQAPSRMLSETGDLPAVLDDDQPAELPAAHESHWLRRRRVDGTLNRVPLMFYPKVWRVLRRVRALRTHQHELPQRPTVQDMTPGEIKFALRVESMLNAIPLPEYRQIVIEILMLLSLAIESQSAWLSDDAVIDLDAIANEAVRLFASDLMPPDTPTSPRSDRVALADPASNDVLRRMFFSTAPSGHYGTMVYLARALFAMYRPSLAGATCMVS